MGCFARASRASSFNTDGTRTGQVTAREQHCSVTRNAQQTDLERQKQRATGKRHTQKKCESVPHVNGHGVELKVPPCGR